MAGLLDYIEAPLHQVGGLFGLGGSTPAPQPAAAPQASSAAYLGLPQPVVHSAVANFFDNMLGSPMATHDRQAYEAAKTQWQNQRLQSIYSSLPDEQSRQAFSLDPQGYTTEIEKGIGPQVVKDSERLIRNPLSGGNVDAQHLGVTPQGATFTQSGGGPTVNSGGPGSVITAPVTDSLTQYNPPQAPGLGPQGGPPPGAPVIGGAQAALTPNMAPTAPPPKMAPRGVRQNNFGNVKTLPNGQMWKGQVGTDDQGHAIFATPQDGVQATLTNLTSYAKLHGINTLAGVANRWKGAGDAGSYAKFLAQDTGFGQNQKIDLTDTAVQGKVAQAIFKFENGPKALGMTIGGGASQQGPATPPQVGGQTPPSTLKTLVPGKTANILPPTDPRLKQFPPGAVVEEAPGGALSVKQEGFSPTVLNTIREGVTKSKQYDEYTQSNDAYKAMQSAAKLHLGGMRAYALRDTFARVINPGAVARAGTIEAIKQSQGLPANIQAYFMNLKGDGDVPPAIAQQILDVAHGFAQSHYGSAKALNDANVSLYGPKGIDPASVTAPLEAAPERVSLSAIAVPPPAQRKAGKVYQTPNGPHTWTGTGWTK